MKISFLRVSEIPHINQCRRQWGWYRQYVPPEDRRAQEESELIHRGLEQYYRRGRVPPDDLSAQVPPHLWSILDHYFEYDRLNPLGGEVVSVEDRMTVPLRSPSGDEDPEIVLTGKCDLLLRSSQGLRVIDHKALSPRTVSSLGNLDELALVDGQLTGYAYLVWRTTGEVPAEVGLNILIKLPPQPPATLRDGSLSRSLSQQTTGLIFRRELKARGLDPTLYQDVLSHYDRLYSVFFRRSFATRTLSELIAYEQHLWSLSRELSQGHLYPSPSLYRCGRCPFLQPCKEADAGGDPEAMMAGWPRHQEFPEIPS